MKMLKAAVAGLVLSVSGLANAGLMTVSATEVLGVLPDNNSAGVSSDITITDDFIIDSISFSLNGLSSTWLGDLIISIAGPDSSAYLMHRVGSSTSSTFGDSSNFDGTYIFSDGGISLWDTAAAATSSDVLSPSTYSASGLGGATVSLSSLFAGGLSGGVWTLNASDNAGGDINSLVSWTINIEGHTNEGQTNDVPEPSTLAIFALGIMGLASRRFKKQ